jgi:hypothetical protein
MAWDKTYPLLTTNISASCPQIDANFAAIEGTVSAEHGSLVAATSGTHGYGRVSAMLSGTYATIAALTSPATGALAFDTTCGVCRIYNGSSWVRMTGTYYSRVHAYSTATQVIPTATWTAITLGTESYDSLAEFTIAGSPTVGQAGYYLIIGTATWASEFYAKKQLAITVDATRVATMTGYGPHITELEVADIQYLTAAQAVALSVKHGHGSNQSIEGANLILHRLS